MIEFIRNLFVVNHEIIYFIYGLMFFVLGLAIALQSRHSSHLELARSLNWLAAFGFLHGFHEWGDLFIPLQAEYLASRDHPGPYNIFISCCWPSLSPACMGLGWPCWSR